MFRWFARAAGGGPRGRPALYVLICLATCMAAGAQARPGGVRGSASAVAEPGAHAAARSGPWRASAAAVPARAGPAARLRADYGTTPSAGADLSADLARLVAGERGRFGIPGVAVVLAGREGVILAEGFGWADSAAGVRATADMAVPLGRAASLGRAGSPPGPRAAGLLWTLDGRRIPVPPVLGGSWTSAQEIAREARGGHRGARDLTAPGYSATVEVAAGGASVVVVATLDQATAVTRRIAATALALLRAERAGQSFEMPDTTRPLPPGMAQRLRGRYVAGRRDVLLEEFHGRLFLTRSAGGIREEVRQQADGTLLTDDVAGAGTRLLPQDGDMRLVVGRETFARQPDQPPAPPGGFANIIGEYGPEEDPLYLLEDGGRAVALVHRVQAYPLRRRAASAYQLTGPGALAGSRLTLLPGGPEPRALVLGDGRARREGSPVDTLVRRLPLRAGTPSFRIRPARPIAILRQEALEATPPVERGRFRAPELVELRSLDPTIHYDIRYATPNNFMGTPMYTSAHAFLQRPAAEALVRVSAALRARGYGLLVRDAYRPWYVTRMFWDATPPAQHEFVADPARGSRHNRGCAVDLTLYDLATGRPLPMTGGYDEMTERSFARYPGGTSLQRWDRDLLRRAMEAEGFTVLDAEWWHFDYKDWPSYPILNVPFEDLAGRR